ncbi:hypothetical protein FQR65_LT12599 [Abscondita terminalis]|nr:hypothetical protein FQR65_LT12599 [Abscondita terminalis]
MFVYLAFALIGQSLAAANTESLLPDKSICGRQIVDSSNEPRSVAKEGEFPWIASLKYEGSHPYRCIGALINERYVITSGVCLKTKNQNLQSVVLGAHELGTGPHVVEVGVEDKIVHGEFSKGKKQYDHDIALIRLNQTVKYSDYIKPICLPTYDSTIARPDEIVTISGWGKGVGGESIKTKKVVLRRVIPNTECQLSYSKHNITITDYHLCTDTLKDHKAYTCAGDGGGPIMFLHENQWYLEGIISFGSTCGHDFPDVNTNIPKYVKWIWDNIHE